VDFVKDRATRARPELRDRLVHRAFERGLLLLRRSVVRVAPPARSSRPSWTKGLAIFEAALTEAEKRKPAVARAPARPWNKKETGRPAVSCRSDAREASVAGLAPARHLALVAAAPSSWHGPTGLQPLPHEGEPAQFESAQSTWLSQSLSIPSLQISVVGTQLDGARKG
jgi:hypothetical protein